MFCCILNQETTELTGFFFLPSCCPPTADGACFVCLLPKDLRQKQEKKKKCSVRSRRRFHPPNNCELKYRLGNTQSYWVILCRTRVHQPHWIHLSGSSRLPGEPCISDPMKKKKKTPTRGAPLTALCCDQKRATALLMATFHCIIFHTVNVASTCQDPLKFRTPSRQLPFSTAWLKHFHI